MTTTPKAAEPTTFTVRIVFESDWHVGEGAGRPGYIDRLVRRDADGLPYVPAKTLRGIWRDACELLARGLDEAPGGDWAKWVDHIFGSQPGLAGEDQEGRPKDPSRRHTAPGARPLDTTLEVSPARMVAALRDELRRVKGKDDEPKRAALREALTFIKPGVAIDGNSGRARDDHLRFEEMARTGTVLEARCTLRPSGAGETADQARARLALLLAATRLVERLGGKRRRGAGRCRLEVIGRNVEDEVNWLTDRPAPKPPGDAGEAQPEPLPPGAAATGGWVSLPLTLHLDGPLAVAARTVGNVVESLDFVPGTYLLPHVTGVLGAAGINVRAAIARGDVCVLPATIEVGGERGRPVPFAFFAPKGGEGFKPATLINRLLDREPDDAQVKQLRAGYLGPGDDPSVPRHVTVPVTVQTHNVVEDRRQRPTTDVGGVYAFEAINPRETDGTAVVLRTELRLREDLAEQLRDRWWERLAGNVRLGSSKKDDYGAAKLVVAGAPRPLPDWDRGQGGSPLFVWLLSDTLLRGDDLRPDPSAEALARVLSAALGVELKRRPAGPDGRLTGCARVRRTESWHVGWGLPRPTLVGLQAGSCFVFDVAGALGTEKLREVEAAGVGERTAEGFGQVRFNDPLLTVKPSQWEGNLRWQAPADARNPVPPAAANSPEPLSEHTTAFARLVEREAWRTAIRRAALAVAADPRFRDERLGWEIDGTRSRPTMSQLGALRSILAQVRRRADEGRLNGWLDAVAANDRRRKQWERALNGARELLKGDAVWTVLRQQQDVSFPTLTDGAVSRLQDELWAEAVRTLFDACIRAHKRELEKNRDRRAAHGA